MINLEHLTFSYGKNIDAVKDATGTVTPGIWLLLGENGAGKTTLLKLMSGLLRPHGQLQPRRRGYSKTCTVGNEPSVLFA